jgi:hypothetical protein
MVAETLIKRRMTVPELGPRIQAVRPCGTPSLTWMPTQSPILCSSLVSTTWSLATAFHSRWLWWGRLLHDMLAYMPLERLEDFQCP